MAHITGHDRSQTLLLPESLDDYIGPENPVRFIEAFVDGLDLAAAGVARVPPMDAERPADAPPDARLQDDCRFPPRQPQRLPSGIPPIRAAVPAVGPVRPRVARGGWHTDQGGQ